MKKENALHAIRGIVLKEENVPSLFQLILIVNYFPQESALNVSKASIIIRMIELVNESTPFVKHRT